jgi:hypothetical protein
MLALTAALFAPGFLLLKRARSAGPAAH